MLNNLFNPRKDQEDQIKMSGRLPPGQALTNRFPVLHYGSVPMYDLRQWTFEIFGEVEQARKWTWDEFNKLPMRELTMDIHCVTRWSKFDTTWKGVWVQDLIDQGIIKLKPSAKFVIQHCEHGFTTNLDLAHQLKPTTLLATEFDGKPLDPDHGYPLRVIVGQFAKDKNDPDARYFWKGGKWLRGLEFSKTDKPGFWENAGYHNIARVWPEERFEGQW